MNAGSGPPDGEEHAFGRLRDVIERGALEYFRKNSCMLYASKADWSLGGNAPCDEQRSVLGEVTNDLCAREDADGSWCAEVESIILQTLARTPSQAYSTGLSDLATFLFRLFEQDNELTTQALVWTANEVLGPFFHARNQLVPGRGQHLEGEIFQLLIAQLDPQLFHHEQFKFAYEQSWNWVQSLFLGVYETGHDTISLIWLEIFERASNGQALEARRLLISMLIAWLEKDNYLTPLQDALNMEFRLEKAGIDYAKAERVCCERQRHHVQRANLHKNRRYANGNGASNDNPLRWFGGIEPVRLVDLKAVQVGLSDKGSVILESFGGFELFTRTNDALDAEKSDGCRPRPRVGDVLINLNEQRIRSMADAKAALANAESGQTVFLGYERPDIFDEALSMTSGPKNLHRGESILLATDAVLVRKCFGKDESHCGGQLYITCYRVVWEPSRAGKCPAVHLPVMCIASLNHSSRQHEVLIGAKDVRDVRFALDDASTAQKVYRQLCALTRDDPLKRAADLLGGPEELMGWSLYDPVAEYARMGLGLFPGLELLEQTDYGLCSSYPKMIVLPRDSSAADRLGAAKFRSHHRLPVVTWVNKESRAVLARCAQPLTGLTNQTSAADERIVKALMNAATIVGSAVLAKSDPLFAKNETGSRGQMMPRSAKITQPIANVHAAPAPLASAPKASFVAGVWSKVNSLILDDDNAKHSLRARRPSGRDDGSAEKGSSDQADQDCAAEHGTTYVIMDARSQIASMGNQVMGKGTENPVNYPGAQVAFLSIDNIHALRGCYNRLRKQVVSAPASGGFFKAVSDSGWLGQVQSVLEASVYLAATLQQSSVLTHCSDGWDRTAQMCSLAMLMLDGFYRTKKGFCVLIEKEWCCFGHKFQDRTGNEAMSTGNSSNESEERSPVFVLWVDCVYQVMVQFPGAFEFNQDFLIALLDHLTSGRCGTFLFDSEKVRCEDNKSHLRTASVWSLLLRGADAPRFRNPLYAQGGAFRGPVLPCTACKALKLWEAYFFRFDAFFEPSIPRSIMRTLSARSSEQEPPNFC